MACRAALGALGACLLMACGADSREATPSTSEAGVDALDASTSADGAASTENPGDAASSGDGGCGPLTCKTGCCKNGVCTAGTTPSQCGGGGLACVDCTVYTMGCVNQGCAVATCTGCDGCCLAGTCNTSGKTQDNACGSGGAVCTDCTSSGGTCDGNGFCH
jgi:hypothetical protein